MFFECLTFLLGTVFLYGIGLNRVVILSSNPHRLLLSYMKSILASSATISLSYLVVQRILVPVGLQEIYPVICLLIFIILFTFIESIIRITVRESTAGFSVSFLCILLATNESLSIGEALLFVICCLTSFYLLIPISIAIRSRNQQANPLPVFKNSLILFSLAILIFFVLIFDASWLNGGIGK